MEEIKTSETILKPDYRRTRFVVTNQSGEQHPLAFKDIEERVSDVPTVSTAPEEVQNLLTTAKNLLLYSWYYYPFSTTASLQSSIALERALKIKLKAKPTETLGPLLKKAINLGLITDEGSKQNLTEVLLKIFPCFRNVIAHGDIFLRDDGFLHLEVATQAIAQLFNEKELA
jgi:hypothetical protein